MNIDNHVENRRKLRKACKPQTPIKFLVIGESPPKSGEYFYKPTDLRKGSKRLPAQIFRAIFKADEAYKATYEEYLNRLQQQYAFYLDDLSEIPLNCIDTETRIEMINSGLDSLISRINSLQLSADCQKTLVLPVKTLSELTQNNKELFQKIIEALNLTRDDVCSFSELEYHISRHWTLLQ